MHAYMCMCGVYAHACVRMRMYMWCVWCVCAHVCVVCVFGVCAHVYVCFVCMCVPFFL